MVAVVGWEVFLTCCLVDDCMMSKVVDVECMMLLMCLLVDD